MYVFRPRGSDPSGDMGTPLMLRVVHSHCVKVTGADQQVSLRHLYSIERWVAWVVEFLSETSLTPEHTAQLLAYWWFNRNQPVPRIPSGPSIVQ